MNCRTTSWIPLLTAALALPAGAENPKATEPYAPLVGASQRRIEAAQQSVTEWRVKVAELARLQAEIEKQIADVAERLKVEQDPKCAHVKQRLTDSENTIRQIEAKLLKLEQDACETLDELMLCDRLNDEVAMHRTSLARDQELLESTIREIVRRDPAGTKLCDQWNRLAPQRIAAENESTLAQAERDEIVRAEVNLQKSFVRSPEPGDFDSLVIRVKTTPPGDAETRRAVFAKRSSPESLAVLGQRFFSQMTLDLPGLENVKKLVARHDHPAALEEYKQFFFRRLRQQQDAGLLAFEAKDYQGDVTEANAVIPPPTQPAVNEALEGIVAAEFQEKGRRLRVEAELGMPGAIPWDFAAPDLLKDNPNGDFILQLCRQQNYPGMTGFALLGSYASGGPAEHFDRWVEILDDWTLNWQRDAERSPLALRDYHLLYVCRVKETVVRLRNLAMMRPDAVDRMPASSLARLLMVLNEEYLSSAVRLGRSGLYNFRIMALAVMVPTSLGLPEFHAHQWALREGWRQIDDNFVYKTRRDGANFECANDGHENTDQVLMRPYQAMQACAPQVMWLEPFWDVEFAENLQANARYWVHNLKQDGFSYRLNHRPQRMRYLGEHPEYHVDLLADEPEVRRRLWKVMQVGKPESPPEVCSEGMAFQGYYYLRSGWEPDDDFLYFQSIGQPILSGREDDTAFSLYGKGGIFLLAPAPAVDGKTQNIHHGLVQNPGGKAHFASYGRPDVVQEGRFHADDHFDLVEGTFSGVYQYHRPDTFFDCFGSYGYETSLAKAQARAAKAGVAFVDEPIRDVCQSRRIVSLRGHSVYVVTDIIESSKPHDFTQNYTIYTPLRLNHLAKRVDLLRRAEMPMLRVDEPSQALGTFNLGLPNVELRHIGKVPVKYAVEDDKRFASLVASEGDPSVLMKTFGKREKHHTDASGLLQLNRRVAVNWKANGRHVLVTLVLPQGRSYDLTGPSETLRDVAPITPSQEVAGFTATCRDGTPVAYLAAAAACGLQLQGIAADASSLLMCGEYGIALDCTSITSAGVTLEPPARDFTFRLVNGHVEIEKMIHRPIEPVSITSEVSVFTDATNVSFSCATPDVDLRYTLDGSRPTPRSSLYTAPFPVTRTCRVKVRAFREGVTEDVWQQDGTHASVVYSAVFRKESLIPAADVKAVVPGLRYEYFSGVWTELMARSLTMPAEETGVVPTLLDVSPRKTDGAFGIRFEGLIDVPEDGVYTFHAPREFIYPDIESGYDLRVFVAGREWYPAIRWHGHGSWSLPLAKGRHTFKVVFVDLRPRPHKIELMWGFPHPDFTWQGDAPTIEVAGPGLPRQPISAAMLSHRNTQGKED
jgi:hypothetical protein